MITMAKYLLFLLSLYCVSCGVPPEVSAGGLIEKTIQAHGWNQKKPALISFDFRDHHYEIQRDPKGIAMQRAILEPKDSLVDRWLNYTHFSRISQGKAVVVSDSMQNVYAQSITLWCILCSCPWDYKTLRYWPAMRVLQRLQANLMRS